MAFRRYFLSRSLFISSLLCFLCIIVLFSLFNGVSFVFFKSKLKEEIIASHRMQLQHTAKSYANHFSRLETLLYNKYANKEVQSFNRKTQMLGDPKIDDSQAIKVAALLRPDAEDPLFYLESLIIHFGSNDYAVDQDGSSSAQDMFGRAYVSRDYSYAFWQNQLQSGSSLTLLPAMSYNRSIEYSRSSMLLPLVFKQPGSQYQIIALLDMDKAQQAFFGDTSNRTFTITDHNGQILYSSGGAAAAEIPAFGNKSNQAVDGRYWLETTDANGLHYYTGVPAAEITSQLSQWNPAAATMLALTMLIGIAASILFSKQLERPVKQLIAAVTNRRVGKGRSQMEEYAFLDRSIQELLKEREEMQAKITKQRSILTNFGYMSQMKNINGDMVEREDFFSMHESYTVVLYELRFRSAVLSELNRRPENAAIAFREHIRLIALEHCPGSHTFQMEKHQILSVIKDSEKSEIEAMLRKLKGTLDLKKHYCLVTIAVSARFKHPSQLVHAYEQVLTLARQAQLRDETQLIRETREIPEAPRLTASQELELAAAIQGGQAAAGSRLLNTMLDEMYDRGSAALHYEDFAELLFAKVASLLEAERINASQSWSIKPVQYRLAACRTLAEYKEAFCRLVEAAALLVNENRTDAVDPITARVMEIIETRFNEELSLDYLADTLNMSSAYLSAYIKDKTGTNFSEHLNSLRVAKAKELLAGTSLNINDVSRQVGYHNITSFNRMFKKGTGLAPSEYRKQFVLERRIS
ncbi:helix-turn-helix domain-containing protein [Candidatus Pristimantibacillus sp. PTI5]|uniref:helix-turn-helix domain-containing protein n=1 Tax=Candidatus Pristimantibacillus sp. PTI5 TaxID=3400422 RepID=UPI003B01F3DA